MPRLPILLLAMSLIACSQGQESPSVDKAPGKDAAEDKQEPEKSAEASAGTSGEKGKVTPPEGKAPKADKKLTSSEEREYRKALEEGRKLHREKKYAEAIKAFEAALAIYPDDPRALSELGWAAFWAKDLELAEESTRKALSRTSDANLRGSTLYNLGRIQEERGLKEEAILSYQQSLKARPNQIVRERLAGLDASAAATTEILTAHTLQGPFASLENFCKEQRKKSEDKASFACEAVPKDLEEYEGPRELTTLVEPYQGVQLIITNQKPYEDAIVGQGEVAFYLAFKTQGGWFVSQEVAYVYNPGAFGIFQGLEGQELVLRDVIPGGTPEVLFRFVHHGHDSNMAGAEQLDSSFERLVVCGIGPSGKPSCTNPIPLRSKEGVDYSLWDEVELGPPPGQTSEGEWELVYRFLPDGKLELAQGTLKGDVKELPKEIKALLGKHTLTFP